MKCEDGHKLWLDSHIGKRSGERKGRLERGHQHAEILFLQNIWCSLQGDLAEVREQMGKRAITYV
jgi:hypothetical protein